MPLSTTDLDDIASQITVLFKDDQISIENMMLDGERSLGISFLRRNQKETPSTVGTKHFTFDDGVQWREMIVKGRGFMDSGGRDGESLNGKYPKKNGFVRNGISMNLYVSNDVFCKHDASKPSSDAITCNVVTKSLPIDDDDVWSIEKELETRLLSVQRHEDQLESLDSLRTKHASELNWFFNSGIPSMMDYIVTIGQLSIAYPRGIDVGTENHDFRAREIGGLLKNFNESIERFGNEKMDPLLHPQQKPSGKLDIYAVDMQEEMDRERLRNLLMNYNDFLKSTARMKRATSLQDIDAMLMSMTPIPRVAYKNSESTLDFPTVFNQDIGKEIYFAGDRAAFLFLKRGMAGDLAKNVSDESAVNPSITFQRSTILEDFQRKVPNFFESSWIVRKDGYMSDSDNERARAKRQEAVMKRISS